MLFRYPAALALTLALSAPASAPKSVGHARRPTQLHAASTVRVDDLYSRRALRRARIILQLKLLELRAERLERVRKALKRSIPIDRLLDDF